MDGKEGTINAELKPGYKWKNGTNASGGQVSANRSFTVTIKDTINYTANADVVSITCEKGTYLPKNKTTCAQCTASNYCEGGSFNYSETTNQGIKKCPENYRDGGTGLQSINDCVMKLPEGYGVDTERANKHICHENSYRGTELNLKYGQTAKCIACGTGLTAPEGSAQCSWININCNAGTYLPKNSLSCSTCTKTNYCVGGTNLHYNTSKNQGIAKCPENYQKGGTGLKTEASCPMLLEAGYEVATAKANKTECPANTYRSEEVYVTYGSTEKCIACGTGQSSPAGSATCSSSKITCAAGKYLPKNKTTCANCTAGNYCEGGEFEFNKNNDQGLKACPTNYQEGGTGLKTQASCSMNVPSGYGVPEAKKNKAVCSGNTYRSADAVVTYGKVLLCSECSTGYTPSTDHTQCVKVKVSCSAGKYLPKNKTTCSNCVANNYCEGGTFEFDKNNDQGITPCPSGTTSPAGSTSSSACKSNSSESPKTNCYASDTYPGIYYWVNGCTEFTNNMGAGQGYGVWTGPAYTDSQCTNRADEKYDMVVGLPASSCPSICAFWPNEGGCNCHYTNDGRQVGIKKETDLHLKLCYAAYPSVCETTEPGWKCLSKYNCLTDWKRQQLQSLCQPGYTCQLYCDN